MKRLQIPEIIKTTIVELFMILNLTTFYKISNVIPSDFTLRTPIVISF